MLGHQCILKVARLLAKKASLFEYEDRQNIANIVQAMRHSPKWLGKSAGCQGSEH
ncbi:hypothetical protein [Mesorhizobium sp. Root552]|uniref:hypothetical protein n=1 Tax=Mesorhizobium sp. Root552 TaxID=1736555 RepID=UPI000AD1E9AC|nr:hypothetical protein [Mesorhizobium sp. Root552]